MRTYAKTLRLLLTCALALQIFGTASADTGLVVTNGRMYESNGNEFVMRGVNHPHTWYRTRKHAFADLKALGCNTVRVVLASGQRWQANSATDVANVIALCKQHRLICQLEVHDTTGFGDQSGAATLDQAVDYWVSIKSVLQGEEDYVMINLGNEPIGNSQYGIWTSNTIAAIQRMRAEGFEHLLVVDAPNWGQDWTHTMYDDAPSVFAADSMSNTMFSVHMYGVYGSGSTITDYLEHFVNIGLPISVGEFGHNHSDGDVDEDTIFAECERLGLGYLGWSWAGNSGGPASYLDMCVNFDPNQLTSWGQRSFFGANGISSTSVEATIFQSTTEVHAESFQVTQGIWRYGDFNEVYASDNARLMATRSSFDIQPEVTFEFEATTTATNPVEVKIDVETSVISRSTVALHVDLFDFQNVVWETVSTSVSPFLVDSVASGAVTATPSRFVQSGTGLMRSRVSFVDTVQRSKFQARIDQILWHVTE